ncbi:hypothetical protein BJ986_001938 [Phycicoccus badiiscoriae]|uniref:Uncharacterized protein n=1 Tax=Pedococcus badiiscoriae TaxID=642776 RepID=A0A852WIM7_9MICO|nr:hypothetical protein [Pedococcus badiiscoriae]NYG07451.1 hypothetical protein [Pedococcus badiiscoriae]
MVLGVLVGEDDVELDVEVVEVVEVTEGAEDPEAPVDPACGLVALHAAVAQIVSTHTPTRRRRWRRAG